MIIYAHLAQLGIRKNAEKLLSFDWVELKPKERVCRSGFTVAVVPSLALLL
jgi:hypothetical protein